MWVLLTPGRYRALANNYWNRGFPIVLSVTSKTVSPPDALTVPTIDFPWPVTNSM